MQCQGEKKVKNGGAANDLNSSIEFGWTPLLVAADFAQWVIFKHFDGLTSSVSQKKDNSFPLHCDPVHTNPLV